jgi:hypothetical protein
MEEMSAWHIGAEVGGWYGGLSGVHAWVYWGREILQHPLHVVVRRIRDTRIVRAA